MSHTKTRIVVLGGGFAGAYFVKRLEQKLRDDAAEVTLINEQNNFVFTPMLVEAATSALEPRHVVVPIRSFLKSAHFAMGQVAEIDTDSMTVKIQPDFGSPIEFPYDHLVLALGSVTRMPAIEGLSQYAFGLKTLNDALAIRDRAIGMLEMANLNMAHEHRRGWLTFAVVGAGYTGVEAAGELNAFLKEATRSYPQIEESDIRVMLIQRADRILNTLDEAMSVKASKILQKNGVEILLNESVSKFEETSFTLQSGQSVDSHTVIWSAGVAPPPILKDLNLPVNKHGYLECEPDLRVKGCDNIWGIGDCASNPDADGNPYPPTAQHALREGRQAAENLAAVFQGRETKPLIYHSKGTMAPLGGRQAIAHVFKMHLSGFVAWFLWRTFYLGLMPGWGRKVRVAMDWTVDFFFRRDCSEQGLHHDSK